MARAAAPEIGGLPHDKGTGWFTGIEAVSAGKTVSKNHVSGNATGIRADGGPGFDPADEVCGAGSTTTSPFATSPFAINPTFDP